MAPHLSVDGDTFPYTEANEEHVRVVATPSALEEEVNAAFRQAELDFNRTANLQKQNAATRAELDAAQTRFDAAFDLDTYRILRRELEKRAGSADILKLERHA